MKTIELLVKGQVQRVGYRNIVSQIAFFLGIKGTVENFDGGSVKIIAQGSEKALKEFVEKIKVYEWPIDVAEVKSLPLKTVEAYSGFEIIRKKGEIAESLDVAVLYLQKMHKELVEMKNGLNKNTEELSKNNERVSKTNEKLSKTNEELGKNNKEIITFSNNTSGQFDKLDTKYAKVSTELKEINSNLKLLTNTIVGFANKVVKS